MPQKQCIEEGCTSPRRARNRCNAHYLKYMRRESPPRLIGGPERNTLTSVFDRAVPEGDCLVWTGAKIPLGYGYISIKGTMRRVHGVAWEAVNGPVPDGMVIDHICHNRACVKVEHLRLATRAQNNRYLSGARRDSGTGVRNVKRTKSGFQVGIQKNRVHLTFGTFPTLEEAAEVAAQKRRELFGEFAGRG